MKLTWIKTLLILCLSLITVSAFANDIDEVKEAYIAWCHAIGNAKGHAKAVTKFYAPKAVLLPTLSSKILINENNGLDDYFKMLTSNKDMQCTPGHLMTEEFDDVAVSAGTYTFSYTDTNGKQVKLPARFTFVYKEYDDKWLIIYHHSSKAPQ